jgi:hypothetical protein
MLPCWAPATPGATARSASQRKLDNRECMGENLHLEDGASEYRIVYKNPSQQH